MHSFKITKNATVLRRLNRIFMSPGGMVHNDIIYTYRTYQNDSHNMITTNKDIAIYEFSFQGHPDFTFTRYVTTSIAVEVTPLVFIALSHSFKEKSSVKNYVKV